MSIIGGQQINKNKGDVFNVFKSNTPRIDKNDGDVFNTLQPDDWDHLRRIKESDVKIGMRVYNRQYNLFGVVTDIDLPNVVVEFAGRKDGWFQKKTIKVCRCDDLFAKSIKKGQVSMP